MHRCIYARYTRACILYAYMNYLAYIRRGSKVNRDSARWRKEESSTRLWQGSCCIGVHNECAIKDRGLRRVATRMRKLVLCARVTLSSRTQKVFPALLPVAQRPLDLCRSSARSLAIAFPVAFCVSVSSVQPSHDWRFDENFDLTQNSILSAIAVND